MRPATSSIGASLPASSAVDASETELLGLMEAE